MACILFKTEEPGRQSTQVTLTFGIRLTSFDDIAEAILAHTERLSEKLPPLCDLSL